MTEIIEANFSQIKDILHQNKENAIKAIIQEKDEEISRLKTVFETLKNDLENQNNFLQSKVENLTAEKLGLEVRQAIIIEKAINAA